ncbi:hypothetical protein B0H66DRAFT_481724 [Apodospora peruviana]|uniref:Uncharacterized protein n=1 Tax=Apodospora peruviana TaxID=516989 RepID=A0AAE0HXF7_9PEZI|nr:hypothetical protein B0H66DRAFT_481724 [Apodospora peruviana]
MAVSSTHHTPLPDHHLPSRSSPPLHNDCPSPSASEHKTMAADLVRPATPDRASRSSFSSIRENESTLPQTFTHSKLSSYTATPPTDEAVVDDFSTAPHSTSAAAVDPSHQYDNNNNINNRMSQTQVQTQFQPPVTHPNSKLLGYWTPADNFKGWKEIQVKGRLQSKSFGDLKVLHQSWLPPRCNTKAFGKGAMGKKTYKPGEAPIEKLPFEILTSIINCFVIDVPPNGVTRRNIDLMSLLLTSRTLHFATLETLYSNITIPHSRIFHKFLTHIAAHPPLGTIVRRLDFCHFNPSQLFSTAAERSKARNLTTETLLQCLELTPHLQEFLGQEYLDEDLDATVLRKLFVGLPRLQALDLCGCSSEKFKKAIASIVDQDWPAELSIRRLSMHKCLTVPSAVFEAVLPRLAKLTHLDIAGTRVTDAALSSIPPTARITHLNLAKCKLLSARNVIDFLAKHPGVRELQYLSVATDARTHQLFGVDDTTELLAVLPKTLKSLSLKGAAMDASHVDLLRPLSKHLEELAIGRGLKLEDVNRLFVPDDEQSEGEEENRMDVDDEEVWVSPSLKYIDLSDLWGADMDLLYLFSNRCAILRQRSEPLEVVEVAEDTFKRVSKSKTALKQAGWRTSEVGSRGWMVREFDGQNGKKQDDGRRGWKMGAESWGMRKIPVARAEVGGMYGFMMFGRKL